jgi:Mg2+ and Co2+ transporter CorA
MSASPKSDTYSVDAILAQNPVSGLTSIRHPPSSLEVCEQHLDDCAIYTFANVFMREIVLLLNWQSEPIEWDERFIDNCMQYNREFENLNPEDPRNSQYFYCILYTYFQRILRRNFGSDGVISEPALRAFCKAFNTLMAGKINSTTIVFDLIDVIIIEGQLKIQLNYTNLTQEEMKLLKTRQKELDYKFNDQHVNNLLRVLNLVKTKMAGRQFDVTTFVMYDRGNRETKLSGKEFDDLKLRFIYGHYGAMSIVFDTECFNKFKSIKIKDLNIIRRIAEKLRKEELMAEQKKLMGERYQLTKKLLDTQNKEIQSKIQSNLNDNNTKLININERIANINETLTDLLDEYLSTPSGLINEDRTTGPITIYDTLVNMTNTQQGVRLRPLDDIVFDGHAVTMQNIFLNDIESENLGNYYCLIKNTWGINCGEKGYYIITPYIWQYAGVMMIDLVDAQDLERANILISDIKIEKDPCLRDAFFEPVAIAKDPTKMRKRRGGKRRNRKPSKRKTKRKKSYRKKRRPTKRRKSWS